MWEAPTIENPIGAQILTIVASASAIIGSIYAFYRWLKRIFLKGFQKTDAQFIEMKERFDKNDKRFEILDNRIFELSMGKSLKEILKEEREKENEPKI